MTASVFQARFAMIQVLRKQPYGTEKCKKMDILKYPYGIVRYRAVSCRTEILLGSVPLFGAAGFY